MKKTTKKKLREQESSTPYYTILILGANKVGKTQLLHRFNGEEFQKGYYPTFGVDFRIKPFKNEKNKYIKDIQIIDFPGEKDEMHTNLINDFIDTVNAFLVVFDISDEYSVAKTIEIKNEFESKITNKDVLRSWYLIGNKKDLDLSGNKIPPQYRDKFDNFFEISCKTSIDDEFGKILKQIVIDLDLRMKENKNLINELEKENEPIDINFLDENGNIFDEECIII